MNKNYTTIQRLLTNILFLLILLNYAAEKVVRFFLILLNYAAEKVVRFFLIGVGNIFPT